MGEDVSEMLVLIAAQLKVAQIARANNPAAAAKAWRRFRPPAYPTDILTHIHDHKINRTDDLLPWNWAPLPSARHEAA